MPILPGEVVLVQDDKQEDINTIMNRYLMNNIYGLDMKNFLFVIIFVIYYSSFYYIFILSIIYIMMILI